MAQIRPFRGVRPLNDLAAQIIAPPYDVLSEDEARAIAEPNPKSFLHVTRPEVDLAQGVDPHGPAAHAKARENSTRSSRRAGWSKTRRPASTCTARRGETERRQA